MALHLLMIPHEEVVLSGGAHKEAKFLELNPLGQVPVIQEGEFVLRDSQAILTFLAAAHPNSGLGGRNPEEQGQIAQWLSFAASEIAQGPAMLRRATLFGATIDRQAAESMTSKVLAVLESRLTELPWLEGSRLTIADLACSPYMALAHQGQVDLQPFLNVRRWLDRIAGEQWFPAMPGWPAQACAH
jgi:glutathione S-transferase